MKAVKGVLQESIEIPAGRRAIEGDCVIPEDPAGLVLFAHGSGSGRKSVRNRYVARALNDLHLATLLIDLLTAEEELEDEYSGHLRFNIGFLTERLLTATRWIRSQNGLKNLGLGYFGASTGAAAAIQAAAVEPVKAIVSRGGRPDLAWSSLKKMTLPILLIVGGEDFEVIEMNKAALEEIPSKEKRLEVVPHATHLFEEPGALEQAAALAGEWFRRHLAAF